MVGQEAAELRGSTPQGANRANRGKSVTGIDPGFLLLPLQLLHSL